MADAPQRLADLEDVGFALRRRGASGESRLPCGRVFRCARLGSRSLLELRNPGTIVELWPEAHGLRVRTVPAHLPELGQAKFEMLKPWLLSTLQLFEQPLQGPILLQGGEERFEAAALSWALLASLGYPDDVCRADFRETCLEAAYCGADCNKKHHSVCVRCGLSYDEHKKHKCKDGVRGSFPVKGAMAPAFSASVGSGMATLLQDVDVTAVRRTLLGAENPQQIAAAELAWVQKDTQAMWKLACRNGLDAGEARHWQCSVASLVAQFAPCCSGADAAKLLYLQGWAQAHLGDPKAFEVLAVADAFCKLAGDLDKVQAAIRKEQRLLRSHDSLVVIPVEAALARPLDPHTPMLLLKTEDAGWSTQPCPEALSWIREGELAASSLPKAAHLPALETLGLVRCPTAAMGTPSQEELEEHYGSIVEDVAASLAKSERCVLVCAGGFGPCCVASACFLVLYGLVEEVKPGQPKMTANEAIEVLRSVRSGALASQEDVEMVQSFARSAWAKHIERVQAAFKASLGKSSAEAEVIFIDDAAPKKAEPKEPRKSKAGAEPEATTSAPIKGSPIKGVVHQPGDGNCLFHSLGYGVGLNAATLRTQICAFMKAQPKLDIAGTSLDEWIQMASGQGVEAYAKAMSRSGTWGGAPEIAACAHLKRINVQVYERQGKGFKLTVPFDIGSATTIRVLYAGGVHYDALVL